LLAEAHFVKQAILGDSEFSFLTRPVGLRWGAHVGVNCKYNVPTREP